ncbi:MAG: hypothetical protein KY429_09740 [Actinobacteria bacterium]|nr:hypothetical protein [Actinomycetota bacterium]
MDDKRQPMTVDADELAAVFDPRLAEVWATIFTLDADLEEAIAPLACYLRMSYLRGYQDALEETERGSLFRSLGLTLAEPKKPEAKTPRKRGGRR